MMEPVIVICDDEVDLLSELAEWFECNGWTVRTARTVGEALAQLCPGPITCLITDRWTANGDDLLRRVDAMPASRRPGLVAMMTGDPEVEVRPCPPGADLSSSSRSIPARCWRPFQPDWPLAAVHRRREATGDRRRRR